MADDFLGDWQAWHDAREERLVAPHGYLAITGLHWLDDTPQRIDGVPGEWCAGSEGVVVALGPDEQLTLDGEELRGHNLLGPVDDAGIRLAAGKVLVEVANRGGAVLLRPRDPAHPLRAAHRGTPTYPPSPDWVLTASFQRYAETARTEIEIENSVSGTVEHAVGELVFDVGGQEQRLVALDDDGALWVLFADATSGSTTYGAGRQLSAPAPSPDGTVALDFNRAMNLPCAYTAFTTCPIPPPQNRMKIAVAAGEQVPSDEAC